MENYKELDLMASRLSNAQADYRRVTAEGNTWAQGVLERSIKALECRIDDIVFGRSGASPRVRQERKQDLLGAVLLIAVVVCVYCLASTLDYQEAQNRNGSWASEVEK